MNSSARVLVVTVLALIVVLVVGSIFARRLGTFSRDDLILATENDYRLEGSVDTSVAVFAQSIELNGDVRGYALLGAETVAVTGSVGEDATIMAEAVTLGGTVRGNAVILAETAQLDGTVDGEVVVLVQELTIGESFEGTVVSCTENTPSAGEGTVLLPCDRTTAQGLLRRAGAQFASVGVVALLGGRSLPQFLAHTLSLRLMLSLTGVAALVVAALPRWAGTIAAGVRSRPSQMLATGGMVALLAVGITAAYLLLLVYLTFVALLLSPLFLLGCLAMGLLLLGGWVALALNTGNWLVRRLFLALQPPVIATVIGGLAISILVFALTWLPGADFVVLLAWLVVLLGNMGAAYATRLGTRFVR